MNVYVLGCGPSGMVAAHAARTAGHQVVILSKPAKSTVYGAQFLHDHIPGTIEPVPHFVKWVHKTREDGEYEPHDYLRKVYGDRWDGTVSPEMYSNGQMAYDLRATYDYLWEKYEGLVVPWVYRQGDMTHLVGTNIIISTLPRKLTCVRPNVHNFISTPIWAMGDAPDKGVMCPVPSPDFTITYNGNAEPSWYRASRIFGHTTAEWPGNLRKPPFPGVAQVHKPVSTNCDCWPQVIHTGRYGQWQRGVLLHHVYTDVMNRLRTATEKGVAV